MAVKIIMLCLSTIRREKPELVKQHWKNLTVNKLKMKENFGPLLCCRAALKC